MVSRTERITNRLPQFYLHWDSDSILSSLIQTHAIACEEIESEFISIIRAHWIDSASGKDLDHLGGIFHMQRREGEPDDEFRIRVKMAIQSYRGGGTLNAITVLLKVLLGVGGDAITRYSYPGNPPAPGKDPSIKVRIIEFPPKQDHFSKAKEANEFWWIENRSISPAIPEIRMAVETEDVVITNPALLCHEPYKKIVFQGSMKKGDMLRIVGETAFLNEEDVSSQITLQQALLLPCGKSTWEYTEEVGANIGKFDEARFDEGFRFHVTIVTKITFDWVAYRPGTFEVHVEGDTLRKAGINRAFLQSTLEMVKAAGVVATVVVDEG